MLGVLDSGDKAIFPVLGGIILVRVFQEIHKDEEYI
jgi:hypothetical protein